MNASFLLIIALLAFTFGYRFYAKLLAFGVFRLNPQYSTPAHSLADDRDYAVADRHLLLGHHVAALAGGTTIMGSIMALIWGWIPALLWLVVGTTLAGGVYGLGSLWLSARYPGVGIVEIAGRYIGPVAQALLAAIALAILLIMNAVAVFLIAELFKVYPGAVLPFWTLVVIALVFGRFIRHHHDGLDLGVATLIALAIGLLAIGLLGDVPVAFTGALNLDFFGHSFVTLDAVLVWVILILVYGYYATRAPVWKFIRPRGFLTAVFLLLALVAFYGGVLIEQPELVAPEFNRAPDKPGILPWLLVTLTSGALAGFHLLFINGLTAKQLDRETDARYVGYGGALIDGLLALSAVIVGGVAFSGAEQWRDFYVSWDGMQSLGPLLALYIDGFAGVVSGLGVNTSLARVFTSVIVISLLATTLEAGLRVQKHLLAEIGRQYRIEALDRQKILLWLTVGLTAALALHDGRGQGGLAYWSLYGILNLVLAGFGLLLIAGVLRYLRFPFLYVLAPALFALGASLWAFAVLLIHWWTHGDRLLFGLGLVSAAATLFVLWQTVRRYRTTLPSPPQA